MSYNGPDKTTITMSSSSGSTRTALEAAIANNTVNNPQEGKVFLITGAYSGLGAETTKALLKVKGHVILAGRSVDKMKSFVNELTTDTKEYDVDALVDAGGPICDLSDLESVQEFANYVKTKYTKLDVLILNAGIMNTPPGVTKQGYEQQVGTNCLGHFLLAHSLKNITCRQVWVSSKAYETNGGKSFDFDWFHNFSLEKIEAKEQEYDAMFAYQQSKLGTIFLTKEFAKRNAEEEEQQPTGLNSRKLETCALHPGMIDTNLGRHSRNGWMQGAVSILGAVGFLSKKTAEQGAATTVTCATTDSLHNGGYYENCELVPRLAGTATNESDAIRFFDLCLELTKDFQ